MLLESLLTALLSAAVSMAVGYVAFQLNIVRGLFRTIPVAHKIAVVGLPGAGKTSLIAAIFELVQKGAKNNVRIHGAKTIALINRYIARLASGQIVGPTTENDIFVFRISYEKRRLLQTLLYDIEIADFPGEFSERISKKNEEDIDDGFAEAFEETLFNREFFSWIASSSEYLFVIDLSHIYSSSFPKNEIQDLSARIRTSWQVIEDATSDRGIGNPRNRKVHLVFSKIDCVLPIVSSPRIKSFALWSEDGDITESPSDISNLLSFRSLIRDNGRRTNLSDVMEATNEGVSDLQKMVEKDFQDLIYFFLSRTRHFSLHFVSLRLRDGYHERYGLPLLVEGILP